MPLRYNSHGQPIGESLPDWTARPRPGDASLAGRFCRLEPLNPNRHAGELFSAHQTAEDDRDWTYLPFGPFPDEASFLRNLDTFAASADPKHYAVVDPQGNAIGTLALMRIDPENGAIEVGCVIFSPLLQRTPAATEAQFLLMRHVFDDLQYRRYEWKCDALNAPSRQAAQRLGFRFECIFRQAAVYKHRSRDTAWFSILDHEWPALKTAFETWLSLDNFDAHGQQIKTLREIREGGLNNSPNA